MTGDVSSGGVTSGRGGSAGRSVIGVAGGGMSDKSGSSCFTHDYFAAPPRTPGFDGFTRSVIIWGFVA